MSHLIPAVERALFPCHLHRRSGYYIRDNLDQLEQICDAI